ARTADDEEACGAAGLRQSRQAVEPDSVVSAGAARAGRGHDDIVGIGHARVELRIGDIAGERAGRARYLSARTSDGGDLDSAGGRLGVAPWPDHARCSEEWDLHLFPSWALQKRCPMNVVCCQLHRILRNRVPQRYYWVVTMRIRWE